MAAELTSGILIPPDNLLFVYIMWLLSCYFFLFFSFLFFLFCLCYSMSLCFHFLWKKLRISLAFGARQTEELHNSLPRLEFKNLSSVGSVCSILCIFFFAPPCAAFWGETDDSPVWPALHIMKPPTALQEAGGRSDWRSGLIRIIRPPELHQFLLVIKNTC